MFLHLDMDCFYASVEMREYPQYKEKALAVGGRSGKGVLTTCNYIAREKGVRSAMPVFHAKKLCPELICLPVRMKLYKEVSSQVKKIIASRFSQMEMASIDEAYVKTEVGEKDAFNQATELKNDIFEQLSLNCSIGVAPNKMLAKITSDFCKPNNVFLLTANDVDSFMRELPIGKIPGIGPKTQEKLKKMGVVLCSDLWKFSISNLASKFGASGASLYDRSRGRSHSHISTGRERKSVSAERSYFKALETQEEMVSSLKKVYEDFLKRRHSQKNASQKEHHKIFVVMKFSDFKRTTHERITRSCEFDEFRDLAVAAFQRSRLPVRLIGLGLKFQVPSRKRSDSRQLKLFEGD